MAVIHVLDKHTAELIEETAQIATLKAMQEQLVQPVHG